MLDRISVWNFAASLLLFRLLFSPHGSRWHVRGIDHRLWGHLGEVGGYVSEGFTQRPLNAANENALEGFIEPNIFAVPHRGVPHPSVSLAPGPGAGKVRPCVFRALHACGLHDGEHMQVGAEVLE